MAKVSFIPWYEGHSNTANSICAEGFQDELGDFSGGTASCPNAQGYVAGSISELLLKQMLESKGFEVRRIREKWGGTKQHYGDFYIRAPDSPRWFVVEVKGIKSNSEKWHKLYNYDNLKKFLYQHAHIIKWLQDLNDQEQIKQIERWIEANLPRFLQEYRLPLYEYEEIKSYSSPKNPTGRALVKARAIEQLRHLSREEVEGRIEERITYLHSRFRVLETHFVASISSKAGREIATPRKDEFHLLAVDIFLRYHQHHFLFANPRQLESSSEYPNHLQQNYVLGFVFVDEDGTETLHIDADWSENFEEVFRTLYLEEGVSEEAMQVDLRYSKILEEDDFDG